MKHFLTSSPFYGAFLLVLGGIFTAASNSIIHSLKETLPASQILCIKSFIGCGIVLIFYAGRFKTHLKTNNLKGQALRGLLGAIGNWAWILALLYMPLADASVLSLTSAFWTAAGGLVFYHERFSRPVWVAIIVGFIGVLIVLRPGTSLFSIYSLMPLLSSLMFSGSSLMIKHLSNKDHAAATLFYVLLFMGLYTALPAFWSWEPLTQNMALDLTIIAALYTLSQLCLIMAYIHAPASFIAPFKFARLPLNVASGVLFFGEFPPVTTITGTVLILMGYYYLYRSSKSAKE